MSTKRWFTLVAVGIFAVSSTVSMARAKEIVNEKSRVVYHVVKAEVMQVGDAPGHIVGIMDASGLAFLAGEEVCQYSGKISFDLTNGTGPHQSYAVTTCEDKSTQVTLNKGVTTAHPDGTSAFEGTFTFIGGTGRFSGIKGGGSYTGKRMAPVTPGGAADSFSDGVATYTLPSQ